jgi:secreted PhoX family phosphatase
MIQVQDGAKCFTIDLMMGEHRGAATRHRYLRPEPPGTGRRAFLARTAVLGLGLGIAGTVAGCRTSLAELTGSGPASLASLRDPGTAVPTGYGPLVDDPANQLLLPAGFGYRIVAAEGVTDLDEGGKTPGRADGAFAFAGSGGETLLVTNHEVTPEITDAVPVPALPGLTYDEGCPGGVTTVVIGPDGERVREFVSLAGTDHNCAGGPTPWGTWLSCEESEERKGENGRKADHGYVFEVDPLHPENNLEPTPIKALGRFQHEAVAIDPVRWQLYLTEDAKNPNGLVYRYTPPRLTRPLRQGSLKRLGPTAGTLAAMRVRDERGHVVPDLAVADTVGTTYPVEWVPVPDRDAQKTPTRRQFEFRTAHGESSKGHTITRSRKLEGAWWSAGGVYLVSSYSRAEDGGRHAGQVWFLDPAKETLTLVLFYPAGRDRGAEVDRPDNITGSPYGGVIIAEDGRSRQHLLGTNPQGETFALARVLVKEPTGDYPEWAGPTFSPDRRTLFANIQIPGTTFAITGPWKEQV